MAIWRSTLAKTAVEVAATRVAADGDLDFDEVRDEVYAYLDEKAKLDDAAYESGDADEKPASSGSKSRSSKTGGGSKRSSSKGGGKGGGKVTLKAAQEMELNFGAFEGVALGDLVDIGVDEAEDDYGYGDGERDGKDYLSWLASDRNKNEYARVRARLVAEDAGVDFDTD